MTDGKHRQEQHHPLDIDSDDHTKESSNPTLLDQWDEHDELVGEDRDKGPDHKVRHRPGRGGSDD